MGWLQERHRWQLMQEHVALLRMQEFPPSAMSPPTVQAEKGWVGGVLPQGRRGSSTLGELQAGGSGRATVAACGREARTAGTEPTASADGAVVWVAVATEVLMAGQLRARRR